MTWAINNGQPIENVGEEVSIVTQFDEERKWLWELPNTTSKKPALYRKIMQTSSITKCIFKEGNKVRVYIVCKVHSKYKRRRKKVKKKKFYTYKFAKKSKGSPNISCFRVEANCSKPLKMKQRCDLN